MEKICIYFKDGSTYTWRVSQDGWDDYEYDRKCFIVKKVGTYIGIYNLDSISSIMIK